MGVLEVFHLRLYQSILCIISSTLSAVYFWNGIKEKFCLSGKNFLKK